MKFSEMLEDLVSGRSQTVVAEEAGMDQSKLSRFKNGEGTLSLKDIDKLMELADASVITRRQEKNLTTTIFTLAELWKGAKVG
jgi:transcriptional regulator with XRE-family HTH domain